MSSFIHNGNANSIPQYAILYCTETELKMTQHSEILNKHTITLISLQKTVKTLAEGTLAEGVWGDSDLVLKVSVVYTYFGWRVYVNDVYNALVSIRLIFLMETWNNVGGIEALFFVPKPIFLFRSLNLWPLFSYYNSKDCVCLYVCTYDHPRVCTTTHVQIRL